MNPKLTNLTESVPCSTVGCEWAIDAYDCTPQRLREMETLQELCNRIIRELQLNVVGAPMWHKFPGEGGVTGLFLLSESHLACHTYPEFALATFNLYCCHSLPEWPWESVLAEEIGAAHCRVISMSRGARNVPSGIQERGLESSR